MLAIERCWRVRAQFPQHEGCTPLNNQDIAPGYIHHEQKLDLLDQQTVTKLRISKYPNELQSSIMQHW